MSDSHLLDNINSPEDLKRLSPKQLIPLAAEIRDMIVETVSQNGGHLAGNLGVVELTLALHYVFETPNDRIIFDVGHQAYTHKILTGRKNDFHSIRLAGGLSGFTRRGESEYDFTDSGHASTSVSIAAGFAEADKLLGKKSHTVVVIGDGSIGGGVALEGLNFAGNEELPLLVVLNDNEMSISKNVGALSKHIAGLTMSRFYQWLTDKYYQAMNRKAGIIKFLFWFAKKFEKGLRIFGGYENVFSDLGFQYIGPIDGHDTAELIRIFTKIKNNVQRPVLLHVKTVKGKGYALAEDNPTFYHGVGPWSDKNDSAKKNTPSDIQHSAGKNVRLVDGKIETHHETRTFTNVFTDIIVEKAASDNRITAVTAAMCDGTGLKPFSEKYPDRFFDVGIAEQHAASFCAGMAYSGLKPVFAVYSTFLARAADEIIQDVCISKAPVVFAIDRSGIVGQDGETHQGQFDIALLRMMPNMTVLAPADEIEMRLAFDYAFSLNAPVAVRYPKGNCPADSFEGKDHPPLSPKNALVQIKSGSNSAYVVIGAFVDTALRAAQQNGAAVLVLRMLKPIDDTIVQTLSEYDHITFIEDGCYAGSTSEYLSSRLTNVETECICLPDKFIEHGTRGEILKELGF